MQMYIAVYLVQLQDDWLYKNKIADTEAVEVVHSRVQLQDDWLYKKKKGKIKN